MATLDEEGFRQRSNFLCATFGSKDLGVVKWTMGIDIQDGVETRTIQMHQKGYRERLL